MKSDKSAQKVPCCSVEVSIVMPCSNEADTLETCIKKTQRTLREHNIVGETIVAGSGSTDGLPTFGARMGARVIHVEAKDMATL